MLKLAEQKEGEKPDSNGKNTDQNCEVKTLPKRRSSVANKFKEISRRAQQKTEENALLASYYVRDAWAGRLENGLGKNSKKPAAVFRAFKIQTSNQWTNANLFAIFCHSALILSDITLATNFLSLLCVIIFGTDIALKMAYMGVKTYLSKQWQFIYMILVGFLLLESLVSFFINHRLFVLYCFRPVLLCLRERSIRRFFTVVKDMGPGFLEVCFPLVFFLIFVSGFATIWFKADLPDQFSSVGVALYSYWMLISTGDTYTDLLPQNMKTSGVYMATFFVILIVGNLFLLSMLMGVTFEVFLDHTKRQVKKERLKELKGLLKAFTILDDDQTGTIEQDAFSKFLSHLKPGLSDNEHMLYYELATNHETNVNAIDFLDLRKILSYNFSFEDEPHKLVKTPSTKESRMKMLYYEVFSRLHNVIQSEWYSKKFVNMTAIADFLLLFVGHNSPTFFLTHFTFVAAVSDVFLHSVDSGLFKYWKTASGHERVAIVAVFAQLFLLSGWLEEVFPELITSLMIFRALQLARLGRCWRLVQLNENLQQYFGCFFGLLPVLFQTISFALIIAYFFAMLGMQAYGGKVEYFENPKSAVLTMVQIFFGVDVGTVIEESTQHGHRELGIIFFVTYFVVGVIIAFNLINTIIIQFYQETMDDSSQQHIQDEKKRDERLQSQLFDRITKKMVLSRMTGPYRGLLPKLRVSRVNLHLSGANMRRRLTGNTTMAITTEELRQIQKYAEKFKYKVDLLKIYTNKVEGASGAKDFEQNLYCDLIPCKGALEEKFKDGEMVIEMGQIDHKCYFVHEGIVEIKYKSDTVRTLHKGQMFGEDMLLSGLPHAFNCIAKGDVTVLSFDRKAFLNDFNTDMQGQFANKAIRSVLEAEDAARRVSSKQFVRNFSRNLMSKSIKFQGTRALSMRPSSSSKRTGLQKRCLSSSPRLISDEVLTSNSDSLPNGAPTHSSRDDNSGNLNPKDLQLNVSADSTQEVEMLGSLGSFQSEFQSNDDDAVELEFHPSYWSVADDIAQQYVASQVLEASHIRNSRRFGGDDENLQSSSNDKHAAAQENQEVHTPTKPTVAVTPSPKAKEKGTQIPIDTCGESIKSKQ